MKQYFDGFDLSNFWNDSSWALEAYVSAPTTDNLIAEIEAELGYKLPASYIALMKTHNGGIPFNTCYPTTKASSWADDHIAITGIFGLGREKSCSICGVAGQLLWVEDWGYPSYGVYFADCPSAGHDMILLDYRKCGKDGEPEVVHVDQEDDYKITFLAKDFETFIRGLVYSGVYEIPAAAEGYKADLNKINNGKFTPLLHNLCEQFTENIQINQIIRNISKAVLEEKSYFSLHADAHSYLLYDIQFMLYTHVNVVNSKEDYLKVYPEIMTLGGEFSTGGYCADFVRKWLELRIETGEIVESKNGFIFSGTHLQSVNVALVELPNLTSKDCGLQSRARAYQHRHTLSRHPSVSRARCGSLRYCGF